MLILQKKLSILLSYPCYYDDTFEACVIKGDTVFMEVPKKQNNFVDNQK